MFETAGGIFIGFLMAGMANTHPTFGLFVLFFGMAGLAWESLGWASLFVAAIAVFAALSLMFTPGLIALGVFVIFALWGAKS